MFLGRVAGGLTSLAIYASQSKGYTWAAWASTYFVISWPGILIQVLLIPSLMIALIKSHLWSENERYLDPAKAEEANRAEQVAFFDSLAPKWSEKAPREAQTIHALLAPLKLRGTVLDVACGNGVLDEELVGEGLQVDAIDVSFEMIRSAKEKHQNPNLTYFCEDFYAFQSDKRYDALLVFDAYPHFLDKDAFAAKAASLITKGGRLYILHDKSKEVINSNHHADDGQREDGSFFRGLAHAVFLGSVPLFTNDDFF